MSKLSLAQRTALTKQFGDRVSFSNLERKLYGHDIAAMPTLIKPFVGKTIPDAVVQPQSEQELVELVHWAVKNRINITPRGKATSGYGGVIPVKGGIVVDFYRMKAIKKIDPERGTATVEAGVV